MSDFKKSQPINASADECYRALTDVFRQMEIDILSTDGVARSIQGHFEGKGMGNKFSIEAVCAPSGENASEITLSFEKFTVRNTEKADLIFIALRRALECRALLSISAKWKRRLFIRFRLLNKRDSKIKRSGESC